MDRPEDANPYAYPPASPTAGSDGPAAPLPAKPFLSGDALVALILGLGILLAATAWLWHYENRRVPQTFWGFESPKIFRDATEVTAYLLRPEGVGVAEKPQYYDSLFMIDELRFVVVKKKDIAKHEGLPRVREMLNDYTNYEKSYATWSNPNWRFALQFHFKSEDPHVFGDYTAMIVFDEDCKLGRPQSVKKVIATDPMSAELQAYFEGLFPEAKELKNSASSNVFTRPLDSEPEPVPTATSTATGAIPEATITNTSDALTAPQPTPPAALPTTFGPSVPTFDKPPSNAFVTPTPAPTPTPSATPTPTAAVAKPETTGPKIFSGPVPVGPAVVPQIPGIPGLPGVGLPGVGGPAGGPLVPTAPAGLNINLGGQLNPPTSPLYQGVPQPGGVNNLSAPTSISVPPLQSVPKPSGTK